MSPKGYVIHSTYLEPECQNYTFIQYNFVAITFLMQCSYTFKYWTEYILKS